MIFLLPLLSHPPPSHFHPSAHGVQFVLWGKILVCENALGFEDDNIIKQIKNKEKALIKCL